MANVKSSEWVDRKVVLKVRKGHGQWLQVRVKQADGSEKLFIMKQVAKHREMGEREELGL